MPRKRRTGGGDTEVPSVASQVDEADVVASVGAVEDPDTGTLVADEERVRAAGAVDAESVRENLRLNQIVDQKRGGVKVPFNAGDILVKYETLLRMWPSNTLEIGVKRLTGTQTQYTIKSQPRTGNELYDAIMQIHGRSGEAAYEVRVIDSNMKQIRTTGQITMPDTQATPPQPQPPQQGQPMTQYPYGYQPPQQQPQQPMYPPQQQPMYAPPQQPAYAPQAAAPQQPAAPAQQPPVVQFVPPQSPLDFAAVMQMQQQLFEMFKQMQPVPAPVFAQPQAAPPQAMQMPPPPQSNDPQAMMNWMQQMFALFQQMQQQAATAAVPPRSATAQPAPPPAAATAGMMGMPPVQPPPGMMFVPGFGFVPVETLFQALGASGGGRPGPGGPPYRGPYGGPRSYGGQDPRYGGQDPRYGGQDPQGGGPPGYPGGPPGYPGGPGQQQPPMAPKTPAEQFRESITFIKTVANAASEMQSLFPGQQPVAEAPLPEEDDSPVRVIDAGPAKLVINRKDGSARLWETGFANMDKVLKWVGEQREAIQKANAEQPRQQLPPGYVEVGPGYQPPPGYVAIPVDPRQIPQQFPPQQQQPVQAPAPQSVLPQPPAEMPPPLAGARSVPRAPWGAPTIPGDGQ